MPRRNLNPNGWSFRVISMHLTYCRTGNNRPALDERRRDAQELTRSLLAPDPFAGSLDAPEHLPAGSSVHYGGKGLDTVVGPKFTYRT